MVLKSFQGVRNYIGSPFLVAGFSLVLVLTNTVHWNPICTDPIHTKKFLTVFGLTIYSIQTKPIPNNAILTSAIPTKVGYPLTQFLLKGSLLCIIKYLYYFYQLWLFNYSPYDQCGYYFSRFSTSSLPVKALNLSLNHILDKETDQQLEQAPNHRLQQR